jgi:hypothetical protein
MNDRDKRRYDRATRVRTFGNTNAADFSASSKATTLFAGVEAGIKKIDGAKAGQFPAFASKETLLHALTLDLQNISRTARAIGLTENGFSAPYRMPESFTEKEIMTHADKVLLLLEDQSNDSAATKATKAARRTKFIEYELPQDFVANLRADQKAVSDATSANQDKTQDGVQNTAMIGQVLGQLNNNIVELNAIMHNKYARQPEKLRAWQSAGHVERAPQREKKVVPLATDQTKVA